MFINNENYMLSADGYLMPAKKGQQPPDLRYFNQATSSDDKGGRSCIIDARSLRWRRLRRCS